MICPIDFRNSVTQRIMDNSVEDFSVPKRGKSKKDRPSKKPKKIKPPAKIKNSIAFSSDEGKENESSQSQKEKEVKKKKQPFKKSIFQQIQFSSSDSETDVSSSQAYQSKATISALKKKFDLTYVSDSDDEVLITNKGHKGHEIQTVTDSQPFTEGDCVTESPDESIRSSKRTVDIIPSVRKENSEQDEDLLPIEQDYVECAKIISDLQETFKDKEKKVKSDITAEHSQAMDRTENTTSSI